ncbi:MAG: 3D domain-containing protein [Lysinibacillus sp.]
MKFRALLIVAFLMFSISSVANAMSFFPAATHDLDLNYTQNTDFWDALDVTVVSKNQTQEPEIYTVENGDNLYRIALNHNISVQALMNLNDLTSELIFPGDELKILDGEADDTNEEEKIVATAPVTAPTTRTAPTQKPNVSQPVEQPEEDVQVSSAGEEAVKEMTVTATAYTAYCTGCSGTTAIGIDLRANPNQRVIAVDPRVIPLGTKVWVEGYGEAIAGDTGGAIKGNKIDVFIPSQESAMAWGVKTVKIKILN